MGTLLGLERVRTTYIYLWTSGYGFVLCTMVDGCAGVCGSILSIVLSGQQPFWRLRILLLTDKILGGLRKTIEILLASTPTQGLVETVYRVNLTRRMRFHVPFHVPIPCSQHLPLQRTCNLWWSKTTIVLWLGMV